jgi:hypothetical protein
MIRQMVFSRNRYFQGRLLSASDFEAEQTYLRDKQRFRNLHTLGIGVVTGLSVTTSNSGTSLSVTPGYAIDHLGREICVPLPIECALPGAGNRLRVDISYVEQDAEPTTAALSPDPLITDNPVESTRITEGFELALTPIPSGKLTKPGRIQNSQDQLALSLPLAILQRKGRRWMVVLATQSKRIKKQRMKKR